MKANFTSYLAIAVLLIFSACGNKSNTSEETAETASSEGAEASYVIVPESSSVAWKGEVAGVYGHNGVIDITEGAVSTTGEIITGGKVVIDMTSIQPLDSASYKDEDGSRASDLVGHLSTGDFFLVEEFPTATFVIKSHTGDKLIGDLTIRGITKEEEATVTSLEVGSESLSGSADLVFNRQDYDVKWVHFMKDMILSDDITLNISLSASAQ